MTHQQRAKSLELRAAMSLSRLWQQQGKCTDAYQLLALRVHSVKRTGHDHDLLGAAPVYPARGLPSIAVPPGAGFLIIYGHAVVLQRRVVAARMLIPLVTPAQMTPTPAEMAIISSSAIETVTQGV